MSKMGAWVMDMQEDAANMTLTQFCEKHGQSQRSFYLNFHGIPHEIVFEDRSGDDEDVDFVAVRGID
jgi:hypothetical protein